MKNKFVYIMLTIFMLLTIGVAYAWSSAPGGNVSTDPNNPNIGTHDLILNSAINMLPADSKDKIDMIAADYGSEMPDHNATECNCTYGIGDLGKHHVYYKADGTLQNADSANRAKAEYDLAMSSLSAGDKYNFSVHVGIMSHYTSDVGVWAHVMGNKTDWGEENLSDHGHYEYYVSNNPSKFFSSKYIKFDGAYDNITAYNATLALANDTTFDNKFGDGKYTNVWMNNMMNNSSKDSPYAFEYSNFTARTRQSINYSVNLLADVLYTMVPNVTVEPTPNVTVSPTPNVTATPVPTSPPSSGGSSSGGSSSSGSSSGGGGGGGGGTAEPYENVYKYEIQEHNVFTTPISFRYNTPELAIYEVMVTSNQSNIAALRIEVLKDTSKLVGRPAPGIVYKNINAWIDYKRIQNVTIRYKVENSWMNDNGLSTDSIKMSKWNNDSSEWTELITSVLNKDGKYTYFESQTDGILGSFAINGAKDGSDSPNVEQTIVATSVPIEEVSQTENKPVSVETPKAPGFETVLSIVSIVSMMYIVRKTKR